METLGKTLWLIPARGGSKGIPNKNLKPFCGESLVGRAVRQATQCAHKDDIVFVSTDSTLIKNEAEKYGVNIPFLRPQELADDTASTYSVILPTLETFNKLGISFDNVVLLQPTSPLREISDIKAAYKLWKPEIDMVVSVSLSKANPYFNLFETDKEGFLHLSKGNGEFSRRQDAPQVWEYNGAIYIMTVDSLLKSHMSKFNKIIPFEMSPEKSIDLDTPQDWEIAEIIYNRTKNKG